MNLNVGKNNFIVFCTSMVVFVPRDLKEVPKVKSNIMHSNHLNHILFRGVKPRSFMVSARTCRAAANKSSLKQTLNRFTKHTLSHYQC